MPLNGEEKYIQALYEEKHKENEAEIALLKQQLQHCQNTHEYLNDYIDKLTEQRDQINGHIQLFVTGERKEGITLDSIIHTMEWKR